MVARINWVVVEIVAGLSLCVPLFHREKEAPDAFLDPEVRKVAGVHEVAR